MRSVSILEVRGWRLVWAYIFFRQGDSLVLGLSHLGTIFHVFEVGRDLVGEDSFVGSHVGDLTY